MPRILIVEDESLRLTVRDALLIRRYEVDEASTLAEALSRFEKCRPDLILTDYSLPDGNGLELITRMRELDPNIPLIMMTGYGSIELAVDAMKAGAAHFVTKPIRLDALALLVERTLAQRQTRQRMQATEFRLEQGEADPFVGASDPIQKLREEVHRILPSEMTVLIQGETGTGKGVLANFIYKHGPRSAESFVDLNCAGLSKDLLESELFGHEKGAFTGAANAKQGLLEVADRGTAFLDEIGDVDLSVQAKLLKVVEDKKFRHLGGIKDRHVDVRLIAATHHDLARLVAEKKFRADLYYRLSPLPLRIPAVRERREDIPALTQSLLSRIARELGKKEIGLTSRASEKLKQYDWPGNIRELKNTLERAVLLAGNSAIEEQHLNIGTSTSLDATTQIPRKLAEMERWLISKVLLETNNVALAAQELGISRSSLYSKMKEYGIELADQPSSD